jgi:zinc transporter
MNPPPGAATPATSTNDPASVFSPGKAPDPKPKVRFAYLLHSTPPRPLSPEEVLHWEPKQGPIWIHVDQPTIPATEWLQKEHAPDAAVVSSLLAEARRPRVEVVHHEDLIIVFRSLHLDGGPASEVGRNTRIWASRQRIITAGEGNTGVFEDCAQQLASETGPQTIPEFLVRLMDNVVKRAELSILQIDADMTDLELDEDKGMSVPAERPRAVRRRATQLRRAMTPYREVLVQMNHLPLPWLREHVHDTWDAMVDDAAQVVEEVDGILDRARLVQEAIGDRLARELNQRVYVLTMLSGIMLPLTFLTGLLGVNLDGIPGGANHPWAFAIFCITLALVGVVQFMIFRRWRLLG